MSMHRRRVLPERGQERMKTVDSHTGSSRKGITGWMIWRELTAQLSPNRFFGRIVRLFRPSFATKSAGIVTCTLDYPAAGPQNGLGIQP